MPHVPFEEKVTITISSEAETDLCSYDQDLVHKKYSTAFTPDSSIFSHGEDGEKKGVRELCRVVPLVTKGVKIQPGVSNRRCVCV